MSKGNTFENHLLLLIFNNTDCALIGDATGLRGSSTAGSLYYSLHTADPGEAGDQTTSEISYTGYARVAGARSGAGFTVTANSVSPAATVTFGAMTAGAGGTVTHFAIGTASSGAGKLLYSGTVAPNIVVSNGVTPQLTTASAVTED
jgi:hypothetical protein